ncbi:MAG: hypothetical protein ACK535_13350, partial [Cyanobacteriota bacterium]
MAWAPVVLPLPGVDRGPEVGAAAEVGLGGFIAVRFEGQATEIPAPQARPLARMAAMAPASPFTLLESLPPPLESA